MQVYPICYTHTINKETNRMTTLYYERATSCCFLLSILIVSLSILLLSQIVQSVGLPNIGSNNNNNNNNNNVNQQVFNPYIARQQTTMLFPGKTTQVPTNFSSPISSIQQQQQQTSQAQAQAQAQFSLQLNPYTRATHDLLLDLRQQMLTRSIKFDEHFRNLLSSSKLSLHNMFADTYGIMYEYNTEIFTGMFEGLEQYYANGQIKLTKSMENFFERLYQKIFQVYNSNKAFSPSYLECATEQLAHLKPFKDVPDKLIDGIRHSFVAARTFVQALNNGIDVIRNIISLGQPAQCTNLINEKLLKNTLIATSNQQARSPCLNFCEQVINKCIGRGNLEQLNVSWRGYVAALSELAMKLSTSYNIETIIAPLDVQISEAIMNFQENAQNISQQVFQVCGRAVSGTDLHNLNPSLKPPTNRLGKRAANPGPSPAVTLVSNQKQPSTYRHNNLPQHTLSALLNQPLTSLTLGGHLRAAAKEGLAPGTSLLPDDLTPIGQKSPLLIDEIKNYILSTKSFWSSLPNTVCTSNLTLGSNASVLSKNKQSNCFHEPFGLSDINSDVRYRVEIHQQASYLETMRSKIESALAGVELDWGSNSDQRHTINGMPSLNSANNNGRLASTTSTTTTTTTTLEPIKDETEEGEEEEGDVGDGDDGSGRLDNENNGDTEYPPTDFDSGEIEPLDGTTEGIDSDGNQDGEVYSEDTGSSSETSTQPNLSENQINIIDQPVQPIVEDALSNLITPPNQAGAQKSSQTSSKLVINNECHLLFALLMSVALLIVTNFRNNQLFAHKLS